MPFTSTTVKKPPGSCSTLIASSRPMFQGPNEGRYVPTARRRRFSSASRLSEKDRLETVCGRDPESDAVSGGQAVHELRGGGQHRLPLAGRDVLAVHDEHEAARPGQQSERGRSGRAWGHGSRGRRIRRAVGPDEAHRLDAAWPAVHGHREVAGSERGNGAAAAVEHGDVHQDDVHAGLELGLGGWRGLDPAGGTGGGGYGDDDQGREGAARLGHGSSRGVRPDPNTTPCAAPGSDRSGWRGAPGSGRRPPTRASAAPR